MAIFSLARAVWLHLLVLLLTLRYLIVLVLLIHYLAPFRHRLPLVPLILPLSLFQKTESLSNFNFKLLYLPSNLPSSRTHCNSHLSIPRHITSCNTSQYSMAHAQLELSVNCSPSVALRVLDAARTSYQGAASDVRFVCMLCKVLTLLGDLKQIRWILQSVIGVTAVVTPPVTLIMGAANVITSGLTEITSGFGDKGSSRGPRLVTPGSGTC